MTDFQSPAPIRRIVTDRDHSGRSYVREDAPAANRSAKDAYTVATTIWTNRETPAPLRDETDGAEGFSGLPPPAGGARFGVLDLAPGREAPGLHRTATLDYVVCVFGEVTLQLDDSEIVLRQGDVVVQRAAAHAWSNRGAAPARIVFVLIDGRETDEPQAR